MINCNCTNLPSYTIMKRPKFNFLKIFYFLCSGLDCFPQILNLNLFQSNKCCLVINTNRYFLLQLVLHFLMVPELSLGLSNMEQDNNNKLSPGDAMNPFFSLQMELG